MRSIAENEHIEGRESRQVPIFKELRPYLEAAWNEAMAQVDPKHKKISDMPLITRYSSGTKNLRTQLCRIITKAGLTPWEALPEPSQHARDGVG